MRALPIAFAAAAVCLAGCSVFDPGPREFVIKADSVIAPSPVSGAAAFAVRIYGPIGSNLCFAFKEFRVTRSPGFADVTSIGIDDSRGEVCAMMPSYMKETLTISAPTTDPFVIRIHQPDGTLLSTAVHIE